MIKSYAYYFAHFFIIFFLNIYIANYYLAEIFGEYQFYNTLLVLLIALSQMGTMQSFTVFAPKLKNSIKLVYATLLLRIIGYSIITLITFIIFLILDLSTLAFVFLLLFIPLTINLSSILDFYNKTIIDVKFNLIFDAVLFSIISLILIKMDLSIAYIVIARFFTKSIAEFLKYNYIVKYIGKTKISKKYVIWMYNKSKVFILNRIIVEMYARSDILLLGIFGTKKQVGLYAVALAIYNGIVMGEALMARKLFPKLTKAFNNFKETKRVITISILYKTVYFLSAIIITLLLLNDIVFTYLYVNNEYSQSSIILNIMLIGLFSHIFANNTNYLLMLKDKFLYIKRFLIGLVLNIILGYYFYQKFDLEGFTLAIQIVKIVMVSYSVYLSYSYINKKIREVNIA
jgi:O-antigen/teichoic acid export membrane protein